MKPILTMKWFNRTAQGFSLASALGHMRSSGRARVLARREQVCIAAEAKTLDLGSGGVREPSRGRGTGTRSLPAMHTKHRLLLA